MIDTLLDDIRSTLTRGVPPEEVSFGVGLLGYDIAKSFEAAVSSTSTASEPPRLRMSNLGTPCERKLWYSLNTSKSSSRDSVSTMKFLYGHILEDVLLSLVKVSGHKVVLKQHEVELLGVKGHIDCVIDGMLIDIKTASNYGFNKFKNHDLESDDPFGYLDQISSYLFCLQDEPEVTYKDKAGFLVINKVTGEICLDVYDLRRRVALTPIVVSDKKKMVESSKLPDRGFQDKPHGTSNRQLDKTCEFCEFKWDCWPKLRAFEYAGRFGPEIKYLTEVRGKMRVKEVTKELK